MRILTFTSLFPHSSDPTHGIFIYQRSRHLAERPANEVVAVSPVPYFPRWLKTRRWRTQSSLPEREVIGGLTVYHPRYFLLPKVAMTIHAFSMFLGSLRCVRALHREKKIDCIDAHFVYPDGLAAVLLGRHLKVPVTVSARGTDINIYPSYRLIGLMIRWTLVHANSVIAVSASLRDAMVALGCPQEKIRLIPNAVDVERFRPIPSEEARRRLSLPEGEIVVVSVGSLIPSKGHQHLIRAIASIQERYTRIRFYLIGEGFYRGELEKLIGSFGLEERIRLLGKIPNEDLAFWYSAAAVSCLASSREGWPNVVTESLACGTPVVATRVGGIPEILNSPELGILVDQTAEALAEGILQALGKNWNREAISRHASSRTWKIVAEEVEKVFSAQRMPETDSRG